MEMIWSLEEEEKKAEELQGKKKAPERKGMAPVRPVRRNMA